MTDTTLATVQQLAAFLQTTIDDTDASATLYLQIASDMVRDYLQQQLDFTADDPFLADPIGGAYVVLPELPVTDVSLVEVFADAAWSTVDPVNYTVSKRLGIVAGRPGCGVFWPSDPESWRVTYSHGFADIPESIVGAVLGVAARAYATPVGVDSERIGGYNVKYAMQASGFSPIEQAGLNRYLVPRVA